MTSLSVSADIFAARLRIKSRKPRVKSAWTEKDWSELTWLTWPTLVDLNAATPAKKRSLNTSVWPAEGGEREKWDMMEPRLKKEPWEAGKAKFRLHWQDYLLLRAFFSLFPSNELASIQQIGKLIRLRLVHADKRLDGYTIEIKWITRSTDRWVGALHLFLWLPSPYCN